MIWVWKGKKLLLKQRVERSSSNVRFRERQKNAAKHTVSFQTNMTTTRHSNWWARLSPWGSPFLLLGSGVCEFRKPQLPYLFILTWRYVYGFRERGKGVGREGKGDRAGGRGGEERGSVASHIHPDQGLNLHPRYVPCRESNLQLFSAQDNPPTNWATQPGQLPYFFNKEPIDVFHM